MGIWFSKAASPEDQFRALYHALSAHAEELGEKLSQEDLSFAVEALLQKKVTPEGALQFQTLVGKISYSGQPGSAQLNPSDDEITTMVDLLISMQPKEPSRGLPQPAPRVQAPPPPPPAAARPVQPVAAPSQAAAIPPLSLRGKQCLYVQARHGGTLMLGANFIPEHEAYRKKAPFLNFFERVKNEKIPESFNIPTEASPPTQVAQSRLNIDSRIDSLESDIVRKLSDMKTDASGSLMIEFPSGGALLVDVTARKTVSTQTNTSYSNNLFTQILYISAEGQPQITEKQVSQEVVYSREMPKKTSNAMDYHQTLKTIFDQEGRSDGLCTVRKFQ